MRFRHEIKYLITPFMKQVLTSRISAVLDMDKNAGKPYHVTSVYFDDQYDTAYHHKQEGLLAREKYRVRYYDNKQSTLKFECKIKRGELSRKETAVVEPQHFEKMLHKDFSFARDFSEPIWQSFNALLKANLMRPVVVVDFEREAYTYKAGNVRITFDSSLSASNRLNQDGMHYKVLSDIILEIKYDDFLPAAVSGLFSGIALNPLAISKYCLAREQLWEVHQYGFRTAGNNQTSFTD